jgi:peptidoglycan hydrolase-like protein with peptidoglycan-binding domain
MKYIAIGSVVVSAALYSGVAASQPPIPPCYDFRNDIAEGQSGSEVAWLQKMLMQEGLDSTPDEPGAFGPNTVQALASFKQAYAGPIDPDLFEESLLAGTVERSILNGFYGCAKEKSAVSLQSVNPEANLAEWGRLVRVAAGGVQDARTTTLVVRGPDGAKYSNNNLVTELGSEPGVYYFYPEFHRFDTQRSEWLPNGAYSVWIVSRDGVSNEAAMTVVDGAGQEAGILIDDTALAEENDEAAVLQAQIISLQEQVSSLLRQIAGCAKLGSDMEAGDRGPEVGRLHAALAAQGYPIDLEEETRMEFGPTTRQAVESFQEAHRARILDPLNLPAPTGYVGSRTRAVLNEGIVCN